MVQFKDKTLLITGGGTGIGEAIAYQFAQRGPISSHREVLT